MQCQLNRSWICGNKPVQVVKLRIRHHQESGNIAVSVSYSRNRQPGVLRMIDQIESVASRFKLHGMSNCELLHNRHVDISCVSHTEGRPCRGERTNSSRDQLCRWID